MAKKKSGRSSNSNKNQSRRSNTFENATSGTTSGVTSAISRIPGSAIYWGLGAVALGAAAVGAYMYRSQIVELYEEGVEYMNGEADELEDEGKKASSFGSMSASSSGSKGKSKSLNSATANSQYPG